MGPLGFGMVGAGALMIWAGFQGVQLLDVVKSVLSGTPLPGKGATVGEAIPVTPTAPPVTAADDEAAQQWSAFGASDDAGVGGSITTGSGETFYFN